MLWRQDALVCLPWTTFRPELRVPWPASSSTVQATGPAYKPIPRDASGDRAHMSKCRYRRSGAVRATIATASTGNLGARERGREIMKISRMNGGTSIAGAQESALDGERAVTSACPSLRG